MEWIVWSMGAESFMSVAREAAAALPNDEARQRGEAVGSIVGGVFNKIPGRPDIRWPCRVAFPRPVARDFYRLLRHSIRRLEREEEQRKRLGGAFR